MARITVEDCLDKVPNRFALVMLVAKRAKQLIKGAKPTMNFKGNKNVVNALREVAKGTVAFDGVSDSKAAQDIQEDLLR